MSIIHDELNKLGIVCGSFSILQDIASTKNIGKRATAVRHFPCCLAD